MNTNNYEIILKEKIFKIYQQIFKCLADFPKRNRYTLGEKIEIILLDLLELISTASIVTKNLKEPYLYKASAKLESLKLLLRLSYELNLLGDHQYISLEEKAIEIGKMVGGWISWARTQ